MMRFISSQYFGYVELFGIQETIINNSLHSLWSYLISGDGSDGRFSLLDNRGVILSNKEIFVVGFTSVAGEINRERFDVIKSVASPITSLGQSSALTETFRITNEVSPPGANVVFTPGDVGVLGGAVIRVIFSGMDSVQKNTYAVVSSEIDDRLNVIPLYPGVAADKLLPASGASRSFEYVLLGNYDISSDVEAPLANVNGWDGSTELDGDIPTLFTGYRIRRILSTTELPKNNNMRVSEVFSEFAPAPMFPKEHEIDTLDKGNLDKITFSVCTNAVHTMKVSGNVGYEARRSNADVTAADYVTPTTPLMDQIDTISAVRGHDALFETFLASLSEERDRFFIARWTIPCTVKVDILTAQQTVTTVWIQGRIGLRIERKSFGRQLPQVCYTFEPMMEGVGGVIPGADEQSALRIAYTCYIKDFILHRNTITN